MLSPGCAAEQRTRGALPFTRRMPSAHAHVVAIEPVYAVCSQHAPLSCAATGLWRAHQRQQFSSERYAAPLLGGF